MKSGSLVIYKNKSATVSAFNGEKLDIRIEGGGSKSVRPKDVEFLHVGPVNELPPRLLPEPNYDELLELMDGETLAFEEFCDFAYGVDSVASAWSAWSLLQSGVYFTGSKEQGVTGRSSEEIAKIREAESAKAVAAQARVDFLERVRTGKITQEDLPALREVEQVALGINETSRILKDLGIAQEPVAAHKLLCKLGVWDLFVNPWPSRYDIDLEDPNFELSELATEERVDLTNQVAYAIDDADSHDPDDAISFYDDLLYVHIADVGAIITPESEVDVEAEHRGANLYLPEKVIHMLPLKATQMLGLGLNEVSLAMTFVLKIDADGAPELVKFMPSTVKVERKAYDDVDLSEGMLQELAQNLERFKEYRTKNGALFIDLPEVKVKVKDKEVLVTPIELLPVRELVANAMLATGHALAKWAYNNDVPMPYTTQVEADTSEHANTLAGMFGCRRGCAPSSVSTSAGKHSGLGLEPYIRVTSPLRRYGDLLAHQQLRRYLKGEELLGSDYLEGRIAVSERAGLQRRKLERQCNEYWKLVYWATHSDWQGESVLVDRQEERLTFLIPEFAYEYKNRFGGAIELDDKVNIAVGNSDPVAMLVRFLVSK